MNDVRDSRRKHLDELDKGDEMKEMIERLKQNWTGFEGLPQEEGAFLLRHHRDCLRWGGACGWVKVHSESKFEGGNIYRLRPDFEMPEPVKEGWFFDTTYYRFHMGKPSSLLCGKWIEITAEQKTYLETKPEPVEFYEWVLKVPEAGENGERWMGIGRPGQACLCGGAGCWPVNTEWLNGIRWTQVPVKSPFVEYDIRNVDGFYLCTVDHICYVAELCDLPSIVGLAGVKFLRPDGTVSDWMFSLGYYFFDEDGERIPCVPVKARFYITKEQK